MYKKILNSLNLFPVACHGTLKGKFENRIGFQLE